MTPQERKELLAGPWGWRYKFDKETGVCLSVDDRSLAIRYPLDCDHPRSKEHGCMATYIKDSGWYDGLCYQAHKRIERWRTYLQKELGK